MSTPKVAAITAPTAGVDTSKWNTAGRNVKFTTLDGMLFVAVDIRPETVSAAKPSMSGKSRSVGSTEGNINIPGSPVKMGLNVYAPNG